MLTEFLPHFGDSNGHPVAYGHVTVVNADTFCMTTNPETANFQQLCSWLNRKDCFAIFNHPGRQNSCGTEFNHFNSAICEKIVGMELWNKSEGFSNYYYNDGYDSNDNKKGFFDEALTNGWKIGAAGGFDNHTATWGTSADFRVAILAKNLTREDLFNALKARRFYSTLDKNIALSFTIAGQEMGTTVPGGITYSARYEHLTKIMRHFPKSFYLIAITLCDALGS